MGGSMSAAELTWRSRAASRASWADHLASAAATKLFKVLTTAFILISGDFKLFLSRHKLSWKAFNH
jgi:hypothetical protein